jgi:hypothetical protein
MLAPMRSVAAILAAVVLGLAACGDSEDETDTSSRTITSEIESTPGSGGFIETPQERVPERDRDRERVDELGTATPDVKTVPETGAAIFTGAHRDNYIRARAVCGALPRKKVARDLGVRSTNPFVIADAFARDYRPAFRQAAFEGCVVGLK